MANHFHFEVETPEGNLSRGMHWLNRRMSTGSTEGTADAGISINGV